MKNIIYLYFCLFTVSTISYSQETDSSSFRWGNAIYCNLSVGESTEYLGKSIKLVSMENNWCLVDVNGVQNKLIVARRALPAEVNGIRIFISDNRNVDELTADRASPHAHDALIKDALLCLSDPLKPLLDSEKFSFPIDRKDGFKWAMSANSHMWGYLGLGRSHQGLDINMNEGRGKRIHALVAIEDGTVHWKADGDTHQACLLMESKSSPVYYIYQHLNRETVFLKCLNIYDDVLGYGWDLGNWCTAWAVESSSTDEGHNPDQSAVLRKNIHLKTGRPATNPNEYFDFEIAVPNRDYNAKVKVGNMYGPTWQKVEIEGIDAGIFDLNTGELSWTEEKHVSVSDEKLTIRFYLKDEYTEAGCYELYFYVVS